MTVLSVVCVKSARPAPPRPESFLHSRLSVTCTVMGFRFGRRSAAIVTDKLASYRGALKVLGLQTRHRPVGMRENNRAETLHLVIRRRERKQQTFKSHGSAQRFLSSHGPIYNTFNLQPHLISRLGLRTLRGQANDAWAAASRAG